jgi:hypothetical protein
MASYPPLLEVNPEHFSKSKMLSRRSRKLHKRHGLSRELVPLVKRARERAASPTTRNLCHRCNQICSLTTSLERLESPQGYEHSNLRTIGDSAALGCQMCQLLLESTHDLKDRKSPVILHISSNRDLKIKRFDWINVRIGGLPASTLYVFARGGKWLPRNEDSQVSRKYNNLTNK